MGDRSKNLKLMGHSFSYQGIDLGSDGEMWTCSLGKRALITSSDFLKHLKTRVSEKTLFVTEYLVPDMDFDALRDVRILLYKENFPSSYLPIHMPPLLHIPMEQRLKGQSATDFLKLFRLEQYEGLAGYGQTFAKSLVEIFEKIPLEDSEDYELEARVKDVLHAFSSPLLRTVLEEIRSWLIDEKEKIMQIEKHLIKLRLELESIIIHQKEALEKLVEALKSMKGKTWVVPFYSLSLCIEALYLEIYESKNPSWPKLTLLTNILEAKDNADSWMTYPLKRKFLAPFILKCAFVAIKDQFSMKELIDAILQFDEMALDISISRLKGIPTTKENAVIEALQSVFYQIASLFSDQIAPAISKNEREVYDQSALLLLPAFIKEVPLLMMDPRNQERLALTQEGHKILNF